VIDLPSVRARLVQASGGPCTSIGKTISLWDSKQKLLWLLFHPLLLDTTALPVSRVLIVQYDRATRHPFPANGDRMYVAEVPYQGSYNCYALGCRTRYVARVCRAHLLRCISFCSSRTRRRFVQLSPEDRQTLANHGVDADDFHRRLNSLNTCVQPCEMHSARFKCCLWSCLWFSVPPILFAGCWNLCASLAWNCSAKVRRLHCQAVSVDGGVGSLKTGLGLIWSELRLTQSIKSDSVPVAHLHGACCLLGRDSSDPTHTSAFKRASWRDRAGAASQMRTVRGWRWRGATRRRCSSESTSTSTLRRT
jgi:hypothetical protein